MGLRTIADFDFSGKRILLRGDLDVSYKDGQVVDPKRLNILCETIIKLSALSPSKIVILGHLGRPEGVFKEELSLANVAAYLSSKLIKSIKLIPFSPSEKFYRVLNEVQKAKEQIVMIENLRFWPQEEGNSEAFANEVASMGDIFVNEAFAASHREHASIVTLPKLINSCVGIRFEKEIENLNKVLLKPQKPVVAFISGVKEDKLAYIEDLKRFCDQIFIGGRLPLFLDEDLVDPMLFVAKLNQDKEDITLKSIESFEEAAARAGTLIISGPIGKYEEEGHRLGTKRVFEAVSKSRAFKVAGGGDTIGAIDLLGLTGSFDWISLGGGAMLEFLAKGTLPGIDVLLN